MDNNSKGGIVMVTLANNRRIKLDKEDNRKILNELHSANRPNIKQDYNDFLKSCMKVSARVTKNNTQRLF